MAAQSQFIYRYDGTFDGFLCCVAEAFRDKALPQGIQLLDEPQATLFPVKEVAAQPGLAQRVERSLVSRVSPEAHGMVRRGFLTCMEEKELHLLRFILLGYKHGRKVTRLAINPDVHALDKALLYLKNEAHYHVEFLRFADCGGFLVAVITPNNMVLPLIAPHFCERFNTESFVIYEKTHSLGFVHQAGGRRAFFPAEGLELPAPTEDEEKFRALWRLFYDTIAVEGRINPQLRRGNMPMRYWPNMTEFQRDGFV